MSEAITTARPYAQAAFDEAQKLNALKSWSEMLLSLAEAVENPEVHAVITNPRVAKKQIEGLVEALIGSGASQQQRNFVRILADNQRLLELTEIAALFEALKAEAEKTVNVVVDAAFELSSAQQDKIVSSLKKRMGREIKLTCKVNKELLGGVVIRAGDQVIDGSARARLNEMANALA
ncbi:F0F1 ATP synthase subunit delta [Sideroxydans lithotrophicus]|uniref:ATP synthase subunit delta n=1 Tax=Sideroxydans lithotrophicus (strain ES-1) TaxID=580332 RepID=D5CQI8_SIDLE|nr:F0F1 ATP synthase subunit delta [Sideroxydans lithotrophicus]ADE13209.1 ATP synthase F1, delta subunit [Sideroxydans lithotrophicus ES-1]